MRNVLVIMKSNLYRFSKEKTMIVMVLIIMPIVISLGVYFSDDGNISGRIAMVAVPADSSEVIKGKFDGNDKLKIDFFDDSVSRTSLIKGIYIAELDFRYMDGGIPRITSYGNKEIKLTIESSLKGEEYVSESNSGGALEKIIGFLIMFLFIGAVSMVMDFFLTDRDNGTTNRVLSGNVSYLEYMGGQLAYSLIILTIPSTLWTMAIVKILDVNIGISYLILFIILVLVGFLSSSFAMFIATIFEDRAGASMGGSIITLITCLLAGCLVTFQDSNKFLGFVRSLLPQKRVIDLVNNFNTGDLAFVVLVIIIFIMVSVFLGNKQFSSGKFIK